MAKPILILLPSEGYDPSEAAIPWQLLSEAGQNVRFATPDGQPAHTDPIMITGQGLDLWGWVPLLRRLPLVGLFLRADRRARQAYRRMLADQHYCNPLSYADIDLADFDGLVFPGGHAKSMRPYLESAELQHLVVEAMKQGDPDQHMPVAAICHGVLVLARSLAGDGRSAIAGRRVTALTWALENTAWQLSKVVRFWDSTYYRTYPEAPGEPAGYRGTQQEITRLLDQPEQFLDVDPGVAHYRLKTDGLHRDSPDDSRPAWVVRDGNLVTARWPGDVHTLARTFLEVVDQYRQRRVSTSEAVKKALV